MGTGIGSTFLDLLPPAPATQAKVERPRVANQDRRVASLGPRGGRATRTGIITMMTMMTTIMGTHHIMALVMDPITTLDTTLVAMVMTTGATVTHHAQDMAMMTTGATQALTRLGRVIQATGLAAGRSQHTSPAPPTQGNQEKPRVARRKEARLRRVKGSNSFYTH